MLSSLPVVRVSHDDIHCYVGAVPLASIYCSTARFFVHWSNGCYAAMNTHIHGRTKYCSKHLEK